MALNSMTGYARTEAALAAEEDGGAGWAWAWEIKSVNAKGLDARCRLPSGFDALEIPARKKLSDKLGRGSVTAVLSLNRERGAPRVTINEQVLDSVLTLQADLEARGMVFPSPPRLDVLLGVRGILESENDEAIDEEERVRLNTTILDSLDTALADLIETRAVEGSHLTRILTTQLDELERLKQSAAQAATAQPEHLANRLREQLAALTEASPPVSEDRLAQELALTASKGDVREEIDRLGAHLETCRDLLRSGDPVGRRLDFMCQEMNREANTICSKAVTLELTSIGVDLKTTVEQFREQVQNVE